MAQAIRVRYRPPTPSPQLVPIGPTRVLSAKVDKTWTTVQVAGDGTIPADTTAVLVDTKVSGPTRSGSVRLRPFQQGGSAVVQEFLRREKISNLALVQLHQGKLQVQVSRGRARVRLDVAGYLG